MTDINKLTWAQVGHVTEPGRYMFKFGWLTITADDLQIWGNYPNAAFTLMFMMMRKTDRRTNNFVSHIQGQHLPKIPPNPFCRFATRNSR